ncbi:H-type lectin domain-containing protein [Primorskyibacter sp. S187A]|uniref:H-type lectin domain-containing protein n=1 Tax=Primorskyibacter sp. S187A TaxID=3415130 RepID=UPI003C7B6399
MKRLTTGAIGVDQGNEALFSHHDVDGDMWTGEGPREVRKRITFSAPFKQAPSVHLSLALFDLDQQTNPRADLKAERIDQDGFDAVFCTWSDTRVARVRISWLAIGALASDDDWDIE